MTDERFSNLLAILTVVTTLSAGIVGYLLADVSGKAGDASGRAEQAGLQAGQAHDEALDTLALDLDRFVQAEVEEGRAGNAYQRAVFREGRAREEFFAAAERWRQVAERTRELTKLTPEEFESDPLFPNRYQARLSHESERLLAVQDAENELASRWGEKAAAYTAVLTIFAVALYLFGLALSLGSEARVLFSGVASALLAVGIMWSTVATVTRPSPISQEAATAYADGMVATLGASQQSDYREAIEHFAEAIEKRPTFGLAYYERSYARIAADSPTRTLQLSIVPRAAAADAYEDLAAALAQGLETATLQQSMGFAALMMGMHDRDDEMYETALEHTERAIELNPDQSPPYFNRALALLALGRSDEALAAYETALDETLIREDGERRDYRQFSVSGVIEGALTDLEILAEYGGDDYTAPALEMKELIVAETFGAPESSTATLTGLAGGVLPTLATTVVETVRDFDPERDKVAIYWYHRADDLGWTVVPQISSEYLFNEGDAENVTFPIRYFNDIECLQSGRYKIEMYLNGKLVDTTQLTASTGDLVSSYRPELAAIMCRPESWVPTQPSEAGFGMGFQSPSGDRGMYVFRMFEGAENFAPKVRAGIILNVIVKFTSGLFSSEAVELGDVENEYFMNLSDTEVRLFRYRDGQIYAGAGVLEGAVNVGIVYGPDEWMESDEPYQIYNSIQAVN